MKKPQALRLAAEDVINNNYKREAVSRIVSDKDSEILRYMTNGLNPQIQPAKSYGTIPLPKF